MNEEENPNNNNEEEQQPRRSKRRKTTKKHNYLMDASDQTEEERRKLRKGYDELGAMLQQNATDMEDLNKSTFDDMRSHSNRLFSQVRYTREAVMDCQHLETITARASKQMSQLIKVSGYDPQVLAQKLKNRSTTNGNNFPWIEMGRACSLCFNTLPSKIQFLQGPLVADFVPKERKVVNRRKHCLDLEPEERPDTLLRGKNGNEQQHNTCHQSVVEQNISKVRSVLIQRDERNAVEFLLNPTSFTQSVENIFYFSFLVKKGMAGIRVDKDDGPTVRCTDNNSDEVTNADGGKAKQAILSINMKQWRELCQSHDIETSAIPHRQAME